MADKLARLASWVLLLTIATKERRKGHWIPFGRDDSWLPAFGSAYRQVKQLAQDIGLIELNDSYSAGGEHLGRFIEPFTESVRLASRFRDGQFEVFDLRRRPRNYSRTYTRNLGEIENWLFERLGDFSVEASGRLSVWDMLAVCRFNRGDLYGVRCDFGRFHSNLTSLSRAARAGVQSSTGERLMISDVSNCQPLILGAIVSAKSDAPDVKEWLARCQEGQIYESLMRVLQTGLVKPYTVTASRRPFVTDPAKWSRSRFKKAFMFGLFTVVEETLASPVYAAIKRLYPTVAEYIVVAKRNQHQGLAHELQRTESGLIIRSACRRLRKAKPKMALGPIYDAAVHAEADQELVTDSVKRAFFERFRIQVTVDTKPLHQSK